MSLLIGDLGGTNARFAIASSVAPNFSDEMILQCADFESASSAIRHYLQEVGADAPKVICLAAAGPVHEQRVHFTNNHWSIAATELASEFANSRVRLLNDFEAIAHSIPLLHESHLRTIGSATTSELDSDDFTIGIVGPGTGLGTAGLRKHGGVLVPIASEGSHTGFAPETELQMKVLAALREKFERVSVERLVSGPGVENIYWALGRIRGEELPAMSVAEIFARAIDGKDDDAIEAVQIFFEVLGQFAGDLALTLSAKDGIFIAGGVAQRYPELLETSRFRAAFENKGRYREWLERVPTQLITHAQPGMLGASYCALDLSRF
jgi:glucokinase